VRDAERFGATLEPSPNPRRGPLSPRRTLGADPEQEPNHSAPARTHAEPIDVCRQTNADPIGARPRARSEPLLPRSSTPSHVCSGLTKERLEIGKTGRQKIRKTCAARAGDARSPNGAVAYRVCAWTFQTPPRVGRVARAAGRPHAASELTPSLRERKP